MSNPSLEAPLVSVRNLGLTFQMNYYGSGGSWRDRFVQMMRPKIGTDQGTSSTRLQVLDQISFEVRPGERVGLVGLNGAGKSSLCRCLAGIMKSPQGMIQHRGRTRAIFEPALSINPELTGRENANLLARLYYPWIKNPEAIIEESLAFSELGKFLDAPFKTYSNGMQARLCLSLVSAVEADLLILDEVYGGADAPFQKKITARFLNLIRRSGAVIFVSHDLNQIREICQRVLILKAGRLIYDGDLEPGLTHAFGGSA